MPEIADIQERMLTGTYGPLPPAAFAGGGSSETGARLTPERRMEELYTKFWVDPRLRETIRDIRRMDQQDGRVKRLHRRMARDTVRGGLHLYMPRKNNRVKRLWERYAKRLQLHEPQKLISDARGFVKEGNLPMQWVLDQTMAHVVGAVRMPAETIKPLVDETGRFPKPAQAYEQIDIHSGETLAVFPMWQLTVGRLDAENWDDLGAPGRPYLDSSRRVWRQLTMTETDMVIRRRERAPLRTAHFLEGASADELQQYKHEIEADQKEITTNYYSNRKGSVQAVQGDANLDQIADVEYLLDTFFAGASAPRGLFGYTKDLSRDILEDLKRDYYEEIDSVQEGMARIYTVGFELELMLNGVDPESHDFEIRFRERRTETANQSADRALKYDSLGLSKATVWEAAGFDPAAELQRLEDQASRWDPYPEAPGAGGKDKPDVSVTPGNERQGESATTISTRSGND